MYVFEHEYVIQVHKYAYICVCMEMRDTKREIHLFLDEVKTERRLLFRTFFIIIHTTHVCLW